MVETYSFITVWPTLFLYVSACVEDRLASFQLKILFLRIVSFYSLFGVKINSFCGSKVLLANFEISIGVSFEGALRAHPFGYLGVVQSWVSAFNLFLTRMLVSCVKVLIKAMKWLDLSQLLQRWYFLKMLTWFLFDVPFGNDFLKLNRKLLRNLFMFINSNCFLKVWFLLNRTFDLICEVLWCNMQIQEVLKQDSSCFWVRLSWNYSLCFSMISWLLHCCCNLVFLNLLHKIFNKISFCCSLLIRLRCLTLSFT